MSKKKKLIVLAIVAAIVAISFAVKSFLLGVTYDVTFYSSDGTVLKSEQVKRRAPATPPNEPEMPQGIIFESWDKDFTCVTHDMEIYPIYSETKGKLNVFALSGAYGKIGEYIFLPLTLSGDVCVSGFELDLKYDSNLIKLESVFDEDGALLYNSDIPGIIKMNYVSTENTTADVDLCKLKFKITGNATEIPFLIEIGSIYQVDNEEKYITPEYNTIKSNVYVIP